MAEQDKPKAPPEGAASSMASSSSISDTISELLQNPAQVDIATTLGLLDDPSNPIAGGDLDTSAMLDPSSFLESPSTVVSSAAQTVTGSGTFTTDPLNVRKSITASSSSPSKSLEAISNRLLQNISSSIVSSERGPSVTLAQKSQHLTSGRVAVDAASKVATAPLTLPTSGDTMADLTSIINSIVSREQQAVATVLTSSSTLSQSQSTMTSNPGSIPNPIPIPSATHIPHSVGTSATEQKSSAAKQKESIMHMSMAIPSLGDLCKSLGVNISKETPPFRACTPATSLSSTTPTTTASLPPTAAVDKTEKEASAPVIDQSTAPKVDSSVSTVSVLDEAKKLKSAADSAAGKPAVVIPSSFLAAIQLQPASSSQNKSSPTQTVASSQPQAATAPPPPQKALTQSLPFSGGAASATFLAPSALPGSVTVGKSTPLQTKTKTTSESIGVQASVSQSQTSMQKAVQIGSLASQKQHCSTKTVSTANITPSVATQTTTKSSVSRKIPTPSSTNTMTPPTATPTTGTGAVTIKSQQQAAGSSSVPMDSSAATTTPKDINLPILQFLQANFPALQLGTLSASGGGSGAGKGKREGGGGGDGSSKEVLQVQTLLAHVLQQQQQLQQLQQQAQQQVQKAIASGQPLAAPGNTASTASSQSAGGGGVTPKQSSSAAAAARQKRSTTPVFAQILPHQVTSGGTTKVTISQGVVGRPTPIVIPKQPKLKSGAAAIGGGGGGGFTSPLLLSRQKKAPKVSSTLVSIPTAAAVVGAGDRLSPLTSTGTMTTPQTRGRGREGGGGGGGGMTRMSTRTAAKQHHLTKTLVEPVDAEPMDLDVGEPFQVLELPPHLKDHSYSCYNPEEGERIAGQQGLSIRVFSGIPPARVSYAPPLPDSPNTLYKLLKVIPKKTASRRSSAASSKTPSRRNRSRATPSGGNRNRRAAGGGGGGTGRGTPRGRGDGSKPSSRGGTEEPSASSGSESSDSESELSKVERRRSQRTAGQRKRYVDDLNISFSDEEMQEGIMNPASRPKKEYKGYGEEEDSEYDHAQEGAPGAGFTNGGSKSVKNKIALNPTEGFHHSDVYFEPPPEEANVVERVLSMRTREPKSEEERKKYGNSVEEFFVKYRNYSYLHAEWCTYDKLLVGDKRFDGKAKRFRAKQATLMANANVDDELFNPEYTMADRVLDVATQTEPNGDIVTHYLVKWRSLPYEEATWELEEDTDPETIRKFNKLQMVPPDDELQFKPRPPPSLFKPLKECKEYGDGNRLRGYQLEGVNWLLFNWYTRQNCILADEMGLGKTVQSIVLFNEIFRAGIYGPFLVIAPLSTIANWQREFESWSDFNVVIYHGSVYSRRLINEYELYYRDASGKVITDAFKFNVIVTTYEVMLADESELQSIQWRVVIIDEAHRLKNRNCKLLEGLKSLDLEHRVLLTGTPLQNSVEELFSLLNFLEPTTFPSHVAFLQQFGDLKSEEQVEELKTILKPMMLRRLKEDVEKSLAPKEETIVEVELTVIQKQYYRAILERNFTFLSKGGPSAVPSLLNVMMELRKCCNHPFLIKGAEQQIVDDYVCRHPDHTPSTNVLVQASGKLVLIDKLLPKLKANGHKVLIFSQMVRVLDILEDYLRMKSYLYERIDGNVRGILRQEAIDRFSKPTSDRFVFLLCTRAGGLGINLTAADTVIIYDSDWNPQNDLQAQARCHRIGQHKAVKVYRLITRNTYEREMFNRASLKLGLDKAVLQSMHGQQSSTTNGGAPQMSKKEIEDLLRKGAYGAVMDEDEDANKFCEEDIDQILERRTHVIQLDQSEAKGSTFAKASFVAEGSSDINVDDPDFWQKWAEKAKLDLDELANKDSLVLDTPRLRRKVSRYGNDNVEEIVDMSDAIDEVLDVLPSKGKHGWTKLECLKVEKGLLIYGWGNWRNILRNGKFKKRLLGIKDIENIARTMLVYCLVHFTGDDKVPPYINRLIDPSIETEEKSKDDETFSSFYQDFDEEDYLTLRLKDPELLFQDNSYMKHLRRHANKILLRVRQLHLLRWSMLNEHYSKIMKGTPAKSLGLSLPRPDEPPPAPWWNTECDYSLLVGIVKYGYEQFGKMRSDPALCFKALCGEEPVRVRKKKKGGKQQEAAKLSATPGGGGGESEGSESGEEEEEEDSDGEMESGPSTPASHATPTGKRTTRSTVNLKPGQYPWPSLAEVNTRARRYISAWLKQQRRDEHKQAQLAKERERREREAEASRKKEQKKAELAQKWSQREQQDFLRVISFYGVEFNTRTNRYNWTKFRQLASLTKKSDERLTLYLHDFKQMCWRVLKKKPIKKGLSGIRVEPVNEERATRCLQRISLLSAVREEILPHPNFDKLIQLCEMSFEVPQWWIPVRHDTDLLRGIVMYGIYRSDQLIYNDPELCFKETVPLSALFDPTTNQALQPDDKDSGGSEDEEGGQGEPPSEGAKASKSSSNPVPLGWPKEKAIIIRVTRIVYAFRNKRWPKPMEGLELFTPVVSQDGSSSESSEESDGEGDGNYRRGVTVVGLGDSSVWRRGGHRGQRSHMVEEEEEEDPLNVEDVDDDRDFEIEKSYGLKLTLKKSIKPKKPPPPPPPADTEEPLKLEVRIPLVQLSFPSAAGMKRIPKKRPAEGGDSPDPKRAKTSSSSSTPISSKNVVIVDPTKVSFTDLTGQERVGVINRNTQEKLPLKQSPMLKNLRLWLEGHPHYNVQHTWGPLVIEWGALKPEMYHRILQSGPTQAD